VQQRELRIESGGIELAATLPVPASRSPRPAALLLAGSGPSRRAELRRFADHLNGLGFATLVYDKRGSGQSTGDWTTASMDDLVGDAKAALERPNRNPGLPSSASTV
jgi:alpha-beta hydrolase superfamily lysophospholipase